MVKMSQVAFKILTLSRSMIQMSKHKDTCLDAIKLHSIPRITAITESECVVYVCSTRVTLLP